MLLWRYLKADGWDRLIADPRLNLTRVAAFEDGFECAVPAFAHGHRTKWADQEGTARLWNAAAFERGKFASCWFGDEHESIAMWDLLVGRREAGVAVAVLDADLQNLVPRGGLLLPVQYVRHEDSNAYVPFERPELWAFYKLWGYRHEHEVRLLVPNEGDLIEPIDNEGKWAHLRDSDLRSIIRMVRVFAPTSEKSEALLSRVTLEVPGVNVELTRAYPKAYRRQDGEWWVEGLEPTPDWRLRMLPHAEE